MKQAFEGFILERMEGEQSSRKNTLQLFQLADLTHGKYLENLGFSTTSCYWPRAPFLTSGIALPALAPALGRGEGRGEAVGVGLHCRTIAGAWTWRSVLPEPGGLGFN